MLGDCLPEFGRVVVTIEVIDTRSDNDDSIVRVINIPGPGPNPTEDADNFWFWVTFYVILILGLVNAVHMVQTIVMDQAREEEERSDD